jgi:ABC-type uncharacterized transport system substrate-binding protein
MKYTAALALALGLLAAPLAVEAQQAGKAHRIGVLTIHSFSSITFTQQFPEALRDLGYVEGQNIILEWRSADGRSDRLTDLAADLVRIKADVIVALTNPDIVAAKRATTTIPIVMGAASDPVSAGFVESLASPRGNITGGTWFNPEGAGKILEILRETIPRATRVALLTGAGFPGAAAYIQSNQTAAQALGVTLRVVEMQQTDEIARVLEQVHHWQPDALYVVPTGVVAGHRDVVLKFAEQKRLPAIYTVRGWVNAGGLMVYTASPIESAQRVARYVDRILKGAKPADLPVEQPTKFELVVNLRTAKALGLTIPPSVLARADEIIE